VAETLVGRELRNGLQIVVGAVSRISICLYLSIAMFLSIYLYIYIYTDLSIYQSIYIDL